MQVDPIKYKSKAPGIKRLKLNHDGPLSNFAFKFNLRLCTLAENQARTTGLDFLVGGVSAGSRADEDGYFA